MSKNLSTSLLCVLLFLFLKSKNDEGVFALAGFFAVV
jgi:hypothetical protein